MVAGGCTQKGFHLGDEVTEAEGRWTRAAAGTRSDSVNDEALSLESVSESSRWARMAVAAREPWSRVKDVHESLLSSGGR